MCKGKLQLVFIAGAFRRAAPPMLWSLPARTGGGARHVAKSPIGENRLLKSLSAEDFSRLQPNLTKRTLPRGEVLNHAGELIEHVYFPISGMLCVGSHEVGRGNRNGHNRQGGRDRCVGWHEWFKIGGSSDGADSRFSVANPTRKILGSVHGERTI